MDGFSTPPPIPSRSRQHARRKSLQGPSASSQRVHVQPASPEVISSLITSLSIISSPANQLFEGLSNPSPTTPTFPNGPHRTVGHIGQNHGARSSSGSFGIDYGAYEQPSLAELVAQELEANLDELAAPTPVIRTAKPPSGFSPLTAPKSPSDSSPLKSFLRGSSRPSSKGSIGSKDETSSIGNLSIEPGSAPNHELRRKSSTESWGKKQSRNQRGLMYMSSKERLREKEQDKKMSGNLNQGSPKGLGIDRLSIPKSDSDSFMAENAIGEEPEKSPTRGRKSPGLETRPKLSEAIGSGRFIPRRESSLQKPASATKKRASQKSSRQNGKQTEEEDENDTIHELGEEQQDRRRDRSSRDAKPAEATSKMMEPLDNLDVPREPRTKHHSEGPKDRLSVVEDAEEGAPSPAVSQRKTRPSPERRRSSSQKRQSGKGTPEPNDPSQVKRTGSRLKRLSVPLSPRTKRNSDQSLRTATPEIHVDDRPNSVDSIDDAVDAYLCSPRLSQKIRHPHTGRTISFSEVGDSEGFAVFCCVGMGLTRYITAFYDELALTLKLRLITPDRPGVGNSEPYNDGTATPLSWPDDVYTICQTLKITKFSILAHSAGAIYALATALRMPQHIRGRIHLLAPWIPPSQMSVVGAQVASPPANSLPTSQRILRALPTTILKAANSSFMSATSSSITSSLPKSKNRKRKSTGRDTPAQPGRRTVTPGVDKENHGRNSTIYPDPSEPGALERAAKDPTDPNNEAAIIAAAANSLADKERQMTYDTRLTHAIWDLATSGANPAVDLLVCLERRHTIGFRYVDITRAVVIHHGSKDTRVPVENVRWLGKTMKKCEVRVLEGEGHGLMASAVVMGGVLMEIAREWDDWRKTTDNAANGGKSEGGRRTLRERASAGGFR
ncbi:related to hydrolase, alpha/beta fold family protein [Rhynchosporium secalis]|uniref:Related to hydrolase, alpha/beta fold family protein n=1 Tax=Rhynchosporium secalis TaxID=38038 RepID=A0A1E1MGG3_RHYSE|nr:related to hydrolase, alpha/beta fold family protein [Rhynchosporium secalis]